MKIFAGGVSTETNTFSPIPNALEDFLVQRGRELARGRITHPTLNLDAVWGQQARDAGDTFVFSLMAWAQPSGLTIQRAYEALRDELLEDLRSAMPVDIALLMLHGAMVAHGYEDCEEDLVRRVREIVGPAAVIGVELDLHCHLTEAKIDAADIVLTYKEYPHVDMNERARELFVLARRTRLGEVRPVKALFDCRMVGLYPTSRQPLRGIVDGMLACERRGDVLALSFGHGFPFADLPHVGAKVLAIVDGDVDLARARAESLGRGIIAVRRQIGFESVSLSLEEALTRAVESKAAPVVVADQSDNTGGGAPGDATFALRWLLERGVQQAGIAIFYDPQVVRIARKCTGSKVRVRLGGKLGPTSGDPLDLEVEVLGLREQYVHEFPQDSGAPWLLPLGDTVALRVGTIDLIVASERCQCFSPKIFGDFGIDPLHKRLLITKSAQHFYGAFKAIAKERDPVRCHPTRAEFNTRASTPPECSHGSPTHFEVLVRAWFPVSM